MSVGRVLAAWGPSAPWAAPATRSPFRLGDPLGPTGQDPDAARDLACELTAADDLCFPPEPEPFVPSTRPASSTGGDAFGLGDLLVVALVIALVLVIVWLLVTIVRNRVAADDEEEPEDVDDDLDAPVEDRVVDRERPPDTWRAAAAEHRAAGRYRDAIRCEYRALVGDLARAGLVDEIPGRTSGEERRQLAELAPAVAADFARAADRFDEAWFAATPIGRDDDERFLEAARSVLGAVLAGSVPGRGGS